MFLTMSIKLEIKAETLYWGHKLVTAFPSSTTEVQILSRLQDTEHLMVDFWRPPSDPGKVVDMRVSPDDFVKLTESLNRYKIRHKVQIFDLQAIINRQDDVSETSSWYNKYHTLDEIVSWMKNITHTSNVVRMSSLGKSHENREQYILQIILQYGKDPTVTAMMDKVDLAIVPVLNVDGYVYTWTNDRLWRKNRSPNKNSACFGTDLNRNWKFAWGGSGASNNTCSSVYQGVSAMCENEVQNVDRFLKSQQKRLVGFLDVHNYSQMWMIPWGYVKENIKDYDELIRVGKVAVDAIKSMEFNTTYQLGSSSGLLYVSCGSLHDYVYGSLGVKYAFAVELRDKGFFGFILPASLIEPSAKELFEGLKVMVREMTLMA
ncbi:corticosteroid- binding protein [Desmophyllum pertusum]|uniref:Corticosteroid- binding protein n=1 Tax=Desmophyllum pertusum TaxID=174260 RepID=A0A9W9YVM5_9CNID|nr:corticosteroid- binding protein [Desmophyllum pertusum]